MCNCVILTQASRGVVIANLQLSHYKLETVQASAKVTIECKYEVIMRSIEWCHLQWPWVIPNPGFNLISYCWVYLFYFTRTTDNLLHGNIVSSYLSNTLVVTVLTRDIGDGPNDTFCTSPTAEWPSANWRTCPALGWRAGASVRMPDCVRSRVWRHLASDSE